MSRRKGEAGSFRRAVFSLVRRVPTGRVVTYGQLAALLGTPRAARAVGHAMRHCAAGVPWHRVVNERGRISRRANLGSMVSQRLLLEGEGVRFVQGGVDLAIYGWRAGSAPGRAGIPARAAR